MFHPMNLLIVCKIEYSPGNEIFRNLQQYLLLSTYLNLKSVLLNGIPLVLENIFLQLLKSFF